MTTATRLAIETTRLLRPPEKSGGLVVRERKDSHEVLLVSSISRPGRWTLPKGGVEDGERPEETAAREIAEEAGVRAKLVGRLGLVERASLTIVFYLFRFSHDVKWPENGIRDRKWVDLHKAERHVRPSDLHDIVAAARRALWSR
jgi:8-oxo-dGTP pyrophosphatase MutT (NUDIX family)